MVSGFELQETTGDNTANIAVLDQSPADIPLDKEEELKVTSEPKAKGKGKKKAPAAVAVAGTHKMSLRDRMKQHQANT